MVQRERSFASRFKYDLLIVVVILLVAGGSWFNHHPFSFDNEDAERGGEFPPAMGAGETLLVVPGIERDAPEFEELDFSLAWYNSLIQEVGPTSLALAPKFGEDELNAASLIIITSRAMEEISEEQITSLLTYVERGGVLILELPDPRFSDLSGIPGKVLIGRSAKAVTDLNGSPLQGDFGQALMDLPIHTRLMRLDTVALDGVEQSDRLLEIDGVLAHYHRAYGGGHVYVLGFDFGMAVTALQQGVPDEGFASSLSEEDREDGLLATPSIFVADTAMRRSRIPFADLLERHVLYAPLKHRPAARLWPYPASSAGALVFTHEERGFGDKALYMAEYEAEMGITSTYFLSPEAISNEGLDKLAAWGIDTGLSWHRAVDPIYRSHGLGRFTPFQTALNLVEELDTLEGWAGRRLRSGRVHDLVWDDHYFSTFRKMNEAGLHLDSSYGPHESGDYGYLFGTGLPFYPLDQSGLLIPVLEFPFLLSNNAGLGDSEDDHLRHLLGESRAGLHQLITLDIDADAMAVSPEPEILETWLRAIDMAQKERHWITNLLEFTAFTSGRRQAGLQSSFVRDERTLHISASLPALVSPTQDGSLPPYTLAFPTRFEGGRIASVSLNDEEQKLEGLVNTGDGVLTLLTVPAGEHRVVVQYQGL